MGLSLNGAGLYGVAGAASGGAATIAVAGVVGDSSTVDGVTGICGGESLRRFPGTRLQYRRGRGVRQEQCDRQLRDCRRRHRWRLGAGRRDTAGLTYGVFGRSNSNAGIGVYGGTQAELSSSVGGVKGVSFGLDGNGVVGEADNGTNAWGVYGTSTDGLGVYGESMTNDAVVGKGVAVGKSGVYGNTNNAEGLGVSRDGTSPQGSTPTAHSPPAAPASSAPRPLPPAWPMGCAARRALPATPATSSGAASSPTTWASMSPSPRSHCRLRGART